MTVVAAIPAYNEEIAIGSVIVRARQHVDEVLVIDDGSADCTFKVAELMGATVLRHEKNAGKGAALRTAFNGPWTKKVDILVTLDADVASTIPMRSPGFYSPSSGRSDMVNRCPFPQRPLPERAQIPAGSPEILTLATQHTADFKTKVKRIPERLPCLLQQHLRYLHLHQQRHGHRIRNARQCHRRRLKDQGSAHHMQVRYCRLHVQSVQAWVLGAELYREPVPEEASAAVFRGAWVCMFVLRACFWILDNIRL